MNKFFKLNLIAHVYHVYLLFKDILIDPKTYCI